MIFEPIWEIDFILWLQHTGKAFSFIMRFFTELGIFPAYIILITMIYWCVDRKLGMKVALFIFLSAAINEILKQAIHAPRPFWVDARIQPLYHASTSFGMPSGHAQLAMVWILIWENLRKKWLWPVAVALPFLIGMSRALPGLHFFSQIVTGWIIGGLLVLGVLYLEKPILNRVRTCTLRQQVLLTFFVTMLLLLIGEISVRFQANWHIPIQWAENVSVFLGAGKYFAPIGTKNMAMFTGGFLGFMWGAIFMQHFGGHSHRGAWRKQFVKYSVGMIVTFVPGLGLVALTKTLLSDVGQPLLSDAGFFISWLLMCASIAFFMPRLFLGLKLEGSD